LYCWKNSFYYFCVFPFYKTKTAAITAPTTMAIDPTALAAAVLGALVTGTVDFGAAAATGALAATGAAAA
jgi:hypothetical protein